MKGLDLEKGGNEEGINGGKYTEGSGLRSASTLIMAGHPLDG